MKTFVAVILLLFVATQVEGRSRRESRGLKIYDLLRGKGTDPEPAPAMVPKPQKPSSNFDGFNLEDALAPAKNGKKTSDQAYDAEALSEIRRKIDALFEIENLQMRMLQAMNKCGKA